MSTGRKPMGLLPFTLLTFLIVGLIVGLIVAGAVEVAYWIQGREQRKAEQACRQIAAGAGAVHVGDLHFLCVGPDGRIVGQV